MAWLLPLVVLQAINCPWETSVLYYTENFSPMLTSRAAHEPARYRETLNFV